MGEYDHILSKSDLFFTFPAGEYERSGFAVILHKNLESAEFTYSKHGKLTLHSLTANRVLEMSVKLKFKCARFKRKHCFALVVLNRFPNCFYPGLFTRCHLYHKTLVLLC